MPKDKASTAPVSKKTSDVPPKPRSKKLAPKVVTPTSAVTNNKKKKKANFDNYGLYLRKVLVTVDPNIGATKEATVIVDNIIKDLFARLMDDGSRLCSQAGRSTLGVRELHGAVILRFDGELLKRMDAMGLAAVERVAQFKK